MNNKDIKSLLKNKEQIFKSLDELIKSMEVDESYRQKPPHEQIVDLIKLLKTTISSSDSDLINGLESALQHDYNLHTGHEELDKFQREIDRYMSRIKYEKGESADAMLDILKEKLASDEGKALAIQHAEVIVKELINNDYLLKDRNLLGDRFEDVFISAISNSADIRKILTQELESFLVYKPSEKEKYNFNRRPIVTKILEIPGIMDEAVDMLKSKHNKDLEDFMKNIIVDMFAITPQMAFGATPSSTIDEKYVNVGYRLDRINNLQNYFSVICNIISKDPNLRGRMEAMYPDLEYIVTNVQSTMKPTPSFIDITDRGIEIVKSNLEKFKPKNKSRLSN